MYDFLNDVKLRDELAGTCAPRAGAVPTVCSDRGEFKWDAEAAVRRPALASLWTVWQEDALNEDGRLKDVVKKRENNRVKQSSARGSK
ncbi:hypothetical protein HDU84_007545 [Entophlyctis sp. JEL0112]|nr:hypothetical protein HDU84_007545 [Entophlyctis sp. JEL0112]